VNTADDTVKDFNSVYTVITAYKVAKSKRTDIVSTKNLSQHFGKNAGNFQLELCTAAAAPPPPIVTDRRAAAAAADHMSPFSWPVHVMSYTSYYIA